MGDDSAAGAAAGKPLRAVAAYLLLALIVTAFAARAASVAFENSDPGYWDQNAYLILAINIASGERIADGIRAPLYPAILATAATPRFDFFTRAKLLTIALGAAGVVIVFVVARRFAGTRGALLAALVVALSGEYQIAAGHIACEVLLLPLLLLAWSGAWWALSGDESTKRSLIAGALVALCYLAKANWLLLVAAFVPATLFAAGGWRAALRRCLWFGVAFCVVASPFLVTNWIEFGGPFTTPVNRNYLWVENWDAAAGLGYEELPDAKSYMQAHSGRDVARRWLAGAGAMPANWFLAMRPAGLALPPAFLGPAVVAGFAAFGIAAFGLAGNALAKRRAAVIFSVTLFLGFNAAFAWYDVVASPVRFVAPWTGIVAVSAVALLRRSWLATRVWAGSLAVACVVAGSAALLADAPSLLRIGELAASDRNACAQGIALASSLATLSEAGDVLVSLPTSHLPLWTLGGRSHLLIPSPVDQAGALDAWIEQKNVSLIVLSPGLWQERSRSLRKHWSFGRDGFAPLGEADARLPLRFPDRYPCVLCVVGTKPVTQPAVTRPR